MNIIECINTFLTDINISRDKYTKALKRVNLSPRDSTASCEYREIRVYILKVLVDTFKFNAENVKRCASEIARAFLPIGRNEKDILKHYYDYNNEKALTELITKLGIKAEKENQFIGIIESFKSDYTEKAINDFRENFEIADESKRLDYLQGLYTRLFSLIIPNEVSLNELYEGNKTYIEKEFDTEEISKFCASKNRIKAESAVKQFNTFYQTMLDKDLICKSENNELELFMNVNYAKDTPFDRIITEDKQLIIFNINQDLYDIYNDINTFKSVIMVIINQTYRILKNHKTVVFKIENIITADGSNLKWEIYSIIGIYAEHFIPTIEKRKFYKKEELCYERCEHLGIILKDEDRAGIKAYYEGKKELKELEDIDTGEYRLEDILLDFEYVWYGYTFSDCLSIIDGEHKQNKEIAFIKNTNQLVMIFSKYRQDDRKIPCPICASLNVSSNSCTEIGLKSWECKNVMCPSRSKSNRGKRYSYKSNFMQQGFEDGIDIISRDLIKKWRHDITVISKESEIFEMLFKYYCFSNDNILLINCEKIDIGSHTNFNIDYIILEEIKGMSVDNSIYNRYFKERAYVKRYLPIRDKESESYLTVNSSLLIQGDSNKVLRKIKENTFTAAVTSPPYYNARLYSQWNNLYNYLWDMYEIAKQVYRVMKPGGVYLYNIGDICGNENTTTNTTMGNKRIILGAYTIHIFLEVGFELLDNLLWNKGEPQSNRHKNDGKFTPFYQKPMNVYEHMFLFKKPGADIKVNEMIGEEWKTNIVPIKPIFKINNKGENTLGHTAPFPEDIPNFVIKAFMKTDNDIILEPFAGSGTTIIAANKNSRKSVGIELSGEYIKLIQERLKALGYKENTLNMKDEE